MNKERFSDLFNYDPDVGLLLWAISKGSAKAGSEAGCISDNGYYTTKVDGKILFNHRIIWLLITGEWPKGEVDHINHDKLDNRFVNLRDINRCTNQRNSTKRIDNTSGVTGVHWHEKTKKWTASIRVNNKRIYLGYYFNIADAAQSRKKAEKKYGFHENHGNKRL